MWEFYEFRKLIISDKYHCGGFNKVFPLITIIWIAGAQLVTIWRRLGGVTLLHSYVTEANFEVAEDLLSFELTLSVSCLWMKM